MARSSSSAPAPSGGRGPSSAGKPRGGGGGAGNVPEAPPVADVPLEMAVLRQFRLIFANVRRHFSDVEKACGISGALLWGLSIVADRPGIRVTELGAELAIHQSTASNMVEQLAARGLIRRERSPEDGRVVRLVATPEARALLDKAPKPYTGKLPHALARLDPTTLQGLQAQLERLITAMELPDDRAAGLPLSDV